MSRIKPGDLIVILDVDDIPEAIGVAIKEAGPDIDVGVKWEVWWSDGDGSDTVSEKALLYWVRELKCAIKKMK